MESSHYHGRRGKESVCGISRPNQTLSLMLAMVATMLCVLLWEASPFTLSRIVHSPLLKTVPRSELEEQATLYESRPFLKTPPLEHESSEDSQAALDLADETKEEETVLDVEVTEKSPTTLPRNETLVESEETSLAETEAALAGRASRDDGDEFDVTRTLPLNSDDLAIDDDLHVSPTAKPLSSPLSSSETPSLTNLSSALGEDSESEAIAQDPEAETTNSSSSFSSPSSTSSSSTCDYTIGKWVLDESRPFYSGTECKLWLAPGFSCRLHNHPDPLLDRYRWQPDGCDLPKFNASAALNLLRNKVVAFVGDSLGRQQLQSLLCMLTRGKNDTLITEVGSDFGFYTPRGDRKPNGFAYRFEETNTTIIFKWTVTLARVQPLNISDPEGRNALHIDRPEQFLEDHLPQLDIVVLNSGHHWNGGKMRQNRYDFYTNGKPVNRSSDQSRVWVAYNTTVHNIVHWMSKATERTEKVVYYRSLSPRHFRNGDWNTGGTCDKIWFDGARKQVQEENHVDPNAESAIIGTRVNLLNITSLSLERGETHVSKYGGGVGGQDCLHWCLPGIPDTWNEIFLAELASKFKRRSSNPD